LSIGGWAGGISPAVSAAVTLAKALPWGERVPVGYFVRVANWRRGTSTRSGVASLALPIATDCDGTIQLAFPSMYTNSGTGVTENIHTALQSMQVYVTFPNGEEHQVTFGNSGYTGTVPTLGYLVSDPIKCSVPLTRNQIVTARMNVSVATAATNALLYNFTATTGCSVQWDATNVLADVSTVASRATAITNDPADKNCYAPIILGTPTATSVKLAILSHSYFQEPHYFYGTPGSTDCAKSGIAGAMLRNKACSVINLGGSGEFLRDIIANGFSKFTVRSKWLVNSNRVLVYLWANDLLASRTAVQIMADLATLKTWLNALGITDIWVMTQPPILSASTDKYLTRAGMTAHACDAQRLLLNTSLLSTYGTKCIDAAADFIAQGGSASALPDATLVSTKTATGFSTTIATWNEGVTPAYGYYYNYILKPTAGTAGNIGQTVAGATSKDNSGNIVRCDLLTALPSAIANGDTIQVWSPWVQTDGIHPGPAAVERYGVLIAASGVMG